MTKSSPGVPAAFLLALWAAATALAAPADFRLFIADGHGLERVELHFFKGGSPGTSGVAGQQRPPFPAIPGGGVNQSVPRIYYNNGGRPIGLTHGNFPPQPFRQPLTTYPIYIPVSNVGGFPIGVRDGYSGSQGKLEQVPPPKKGEGFTPDAIPPPEVPQAPAAFGGYGGAYSPPPSVSASLPSSEGDGGGDGGSSFLARGREG